jgi:hypothetical protein
VPLSACGMAWPLPRPVPAADHGSATDPTHLAALRARAVTPHVRAVWTFTTAQALLAAGEIPTEGPLVLQWSPGD